MAPVTLPVIQFVILCGLALVGYLYVIMLVSDVLITYFNKLHAYVIKKGWL